MKNLGNEMKDFREPLNEKSSSNSTTKITGKKSYNKIIIVGVVLVITLITIILL